MAELIKDFIGNGFRFPFGVDINFDGTPTGRIALNKDIFEPDILAVISCDVDSSQITASQYNIRIDVLMVLTIMVTLYFLL